MSEDRFIRMREVEHLVGLKDSRIYEMMKEGGFPKQIKLGSASRWSLNAVNAWMDRQIAEAA